LLLISFLVFIAQGIRRAGPTALPSYAAVVSSVDLNAAKYIVAQRVQKSRQELITELKEMTTVRSYSFLFFILTNVVFYPVSVDDVHEVQNKGRRGE
jgi:hypothetical protein